MIAKDLIIIGAGPAGITAAVYAARKKMDFMVITGDIGGQAAWSGNIENYTGYQFVTGPELAMKFREHLEKYSFEMHEGIWVEKISKLEQRFLVRASKGIEVQTKTLIIASGKSPRDLNVPGEKEFKNKGLTYCATCDGPLFSGKNIAIIGGGNSALDAALQMMNIASRVYMVNITPNFTGDAVMKEKIGASDKVEVLNRTKVLEIFGSRFVEAIKIETDGKISTLKVDGIFVEVGLIPKSDFIDFVDKNESKEIIIDCKSNTSCPGVFAAGDVTSVPEKQIIIAAGDGAKATLSAFKFLSMR